MKHYGDITKINGGMVEPVNVVIGGSPCQDLSVAGKRAGLAGERSGLFMEQIRIIKEMRKADCENGRTGKYIRPRYMVWENVPGAFSSNKGADYGAVLQETVKVVCKEAPAIPVPDKGWPTTGCLADVDGQWSVAWRVFDAQFWGVLQRRRRIALVADFGGISAPEILFERESVSGNSEASGEKGKGTAGSSEESFGNASGAICIQGNCIDRSDTAGCNGRGWTEDVSYTLNTVDRPAVFSFDSLASNSMKSSNPHSGCREVDKSKTLDCFDPNPSKNQGGIAIVQPLTYPDIANTLTSRNDGSPQPEKGSGANIIAFAQNQKNDELMIYDMTHAKDVIRESRNVPTLQGRMGTGGNQIPLVNQNAAYSMMCGSFTAVNKDKTATLQARDYKDPPIVNYTSAQAVRRLTPLECERLQGFPDGWTDIGDWTDEKGKSHKTSDAARYKALGNSIALPSWLYVLFKLSCFCKEDTTMASLFDGIGGFPLIWEYINGKGSCIWASEIEPFAIAVTKKHFSQIKEEGVN